MDTTQQLVHDEARMDRWNAADEPDDRPTLRELMAADGKAGDPRGKREREAAARKVRL